MNSWRPLLVLLVLGLCADLSLTACSTQPPKVSCQSHLTPINLPAPAGAASHAVSSRSTTGRAVAHAAEDAHGR